MRATSTFNFEVGTSTRAWRALAALRIRVNKSEMGSVCILSLPLPAGCKCSPHPSLPARFHDAGDFPAQRVATETDAAHLKFAKVSAGAAAQAAAVAHANLELRLPAHLGKL